MKFSLRTRGPHREPAAWMAAGVLVLAIVGLATLTPTTLFYLLLAALVVVAIAAAHTFENLLVMWIWMSSLVHLLKRAIFLLGPQPQYAYYTVLFLPSVIYLVVLAQALPRVQERWGLRSTKILIVLGMWSLINTVLDADSSILARGAAVHDRVMPFGMFAVGLVIPIAGPLFARMCRAYLYSGALSVAYGVVLYVGGPTVIEREWARHTAMYSIQGQKVWEYVMAGMRGEWRGFSYYADPTTWGLLLVVAIAALMLLWHVPRGVRVGSVVTWMLVLLLGLFICLTRTPWVGLVAMVGTALLLRQRGAQRASVLTLVLTGSFAFLVLFGEAIAGYFIPAIPETDNPVLERYAALGTVMSRTWAWQGLLAAIAQYPVLGTGYAQSGGISMGFTGQHGGADPGGHNFLMEAAIFTGVPGLLLLIAFLVAGLADGTFALRRAREQGALRWLVAFAVGAIVTGFLNGSNFMTHGFFLFSGIMAGARLDERPVVEEPTWPRESSALSSSATRTWSA